MENKPYADVWGDTVDLKHLAAGLVIGIVLGLTFYIGGLKLITHIFPQVLPNLKAAYALLVGIGGCLLAACISARLFAPKRLLKEGEFSGADRLAVLEELQIDLVKEAEELQHVSEYILDEMKELKLYDLFANTRKPDTTGGV